MEIKVGADVKGAVAGINTLNKSLKTLPNASGQATQSLVNFGRVVQDAPFGIIGIANNIDPLIQSFNALKATTGSTSAALSALGSTLIGPAGIAIAVSTITSLLVVFAQKKQQAATAAKNLKDNTKDLKDELDQIAGSLSKEYQKVTQLVSALETQSLSRQQQKSALKELNTIAPEYFGNLDKEKGLVDKLSTAYFLYSNAIINVFRAKAREKELSKISDELLKVEEGIIKIEKIATETGTKKGRINIVDEKGSVQDINTLYRNRFELQNKFKELTNEINGLTISQLKTETTKTEKTKELTAELEKIGLGFETRSQREIASLEEKIKLQEELNRVSKEFLNNAPKRKPGDSLGGIINDPNAQKSTLKILDPSALNDLQNVDKLNEKLLNTKDLINNGLNSGIDQFFNAIANNQDPFKALAQSAARLVTELGAAVVKAFLLKSALGVPGADKAVSVGAGIFKMLLRGSDQQLQLARGVLG